MKRTALLLPVLISLFLASCKVEEPVLPTVDGIAANNTGTSTDGTYQPFTAGSYWHYKDPTGIDPEVSTYTATATTKVFGGKTFHLFKAQAGNSAPNDIYYGYNNHIYSVYTADADLGFEYDLPYLDDRADVNYSWNTVFSPPASATGGVTLNFRVVSTIKEKGITKTNGGKTFTDVIHTQVQLQVQAGGSYTTTKTSDFYIAKNVGLITIVYTSSGLPDIHGVTELFEYSIK
jgi:hypothetical protein